MLNARLGNARNGGNTRNGGNRGSERKNGSNIGWCRYPPGKEVIRVVRKVNEQNENKNARSGIDQNTLSSIDQNSLSLIGEYVNIMALSQTNKRFHKSISPLIENFSLIKDFRTFNGDVKCRNTFANCGKIFNLSLDIHEHVGIINTICQERQYEFIDGLYVYSGAHHGVVKEPNRLAFHRLILSNVRYLTYTNIAMDHFTFAHSSNLQVLRLLECKSASSFLRTIPSDNKLREMVLTNTSIRSDIVFPLSLKKLVLNGVLYTRNTLISIINCTNLRHLALDFTELLYVNLHLLPVTLRTLHIFIGSNRDVLSNPRYIRDKMDLNLSVEYICTGYRINDRGIIPSLGNSAKPIRYMDIVGGDCRTNTVYEITHAVSCEIAEKSNVEIAYHKYRYNNITIVIRK
jgi:hypothetical protein